SCRRARCQTIPSTCSSGRTSPGCWASRGRLPPTRGSRGAARPPPPHSFPRTPGISDSAKRSWRPSTCSTRKIAAKTRAGCSWGNSRRQFFALSGGQPCRRVMPRDGRARATCLFFESACRSKLCLEHDLFRKPVSTFRDHALTLVLAGALFLLELPDRIEPGTRRTELGEVGIERVLPGSQPPHQVAWRHFPVLHVVEEMRGVLQGPLVVIAGELRLSLVRHVDVGDDDREVFLQGVVLANP